MITQHCTEPPFHCHGSFSNGSCQRFIVQFVTNQSSKRADVAGGNLTFFNLVNCSGVRSSRERFLSLGLVTHKTLESLEPFCGFAIKPLLAQYASGILPGYGIAFLRVNMLRVRSRSFP